MFFLPQNANSTKKLRVWINRFIALIVQVTFPLVMRKSEVSPFISKAALVLGFSSASYLMGLFCFTLDIDALRSANPSAWKHHVPPAFYAIATYMAYQAHSTIALTFGSLFFTAYVLLRTLYLPELKKSEGEQTHGCGTTTPASFFSTHNLVEGSEAKLFLNQLGYDLFVYCLPSAALSVFLPFLQTSIFALFCFVTFFGPMYDLVTTQLFLYTPPAENAVRAEDRLKSYAPGSEYPEGWFRVADSSDIPTGAVKYIMALGRDLAVFRGQDGQVRCLDAYCIHLGANMGIRGKVVGNCIECPFHKWTFGGDGTCTSIPYTPKVPSTAKTTAYHVNEFFGLIMVWFPRPGCTDMTPKYQPPVPDIISRGTMVYRGGRKKVVNMHIQEFAENSTDFAHFQPLHGTMTLPFTDVVIPGITINHEADWKEGQGDEGHLCWFMDGADLNLGGVHFPSTAANAMITFVGPAGLVYFTFETPIGNILLMQTHTPESPLRLQASFRWFSDSTMPRPLVWYVVGNWIAQWQNDIFVWENKKFLKNPLLVRGDGPMNKQRRWFRQFYNHSKSDPAADDGKTSSQKEPPSMDW